MGSVPIYKEQYHRCTRISVRMIILAGVQLFFPYIFGLTTCLYCVSSFTAAVAALLLCFIQALSPSTIIPPCSTIVRTCVRRLRIHAVSTIHVLTTYRNIRLLHYRYTLKTFNKHTLIITTLLLNTLPPLGTNT